MLIDTEEILLVIKRKINQKLIKAQQKNDIALLCL